MLNHSGCAVGPTNIAPSGCNITLKPHYWLKKGKMNLMLPSPVIICMMKLPINLCWPIRVNLLLALKLSNNTVFTCISVNLLLALKLSNTVFTCEVLVQQHGAVTVVCELTRFFPGINWIVPTITLKQDIMITKHPQNGCLKSISLGH